MVYDIMYFSPVRVGDERYTNQLYFQTDIYSRTWPTAIVQKLTSQIEELKHVELGILPFDRDFKARHRQVVMFHCKMALAYLDAREARIAMKLCEAAEPATRSTEANISQDVFLDLGFLRIIVMSVLALAARRIKFFQKGVEALEEAKNICLRQSADEHTVHPLLIALTLKNYSAVLGDMDHDQIALRWGMEALTMLYKLFNSSTDYPREVEQFLLATVCHNAALLSVKLGRWKDAVELANEGIEFSKGLDDVEEHGEGLRKKLIAVGAQAKRIPEKFFEEAVNKVNGWGEDAHEWNLSFWDFTMAELRECIHVLRHTQTLKHLVLEQHDGTRRNPGAIEDKLLGQLMLAVVSCQSLERITVAHLDFDPHRVWRRIQKESFLEKSCYGSAMNFANILEGAQKPEIAPYREMLKDLNPFLRKVVFFLVVLGNECEGVDLSENNIGVWSVPALVKALQSKKRPKVSRQVSTVILRSNRLEPDAMKELAKTWDVDEEALASATPASVRSSVASGTHLVDVTAPLAKKDSDDSAVIAPGVTSLDVSHNIGICDEGLDHLCAGIAKFHRFRVLRVDTIGLGAVGCNALDRLETTRLEILCLSNNEICSEGANTFCAAAMKLPYLHTAELDNCKIDGDAAKSLSHLLEHHTALRNISMNHNQLGSEGAAVLCEGAGESPCLTSMHLAYNGILSEPAAKAIADLMVNCDTLMEMNLSGNHLDPKGAPFIGSAIEKSRVLTMFLEDMGYTESTIDEFLDHGAAETQDLQVMILNSNAIKDEGLSVIAECLSIGLTDLSLSNCSLTCASQATLLNLVSLSPNLRSLDLSHNLLGPKGCADMVTWMAENETDSFSLRSLELANCGLGDEGFLVLVPVMGAMTDMGLSKNGITSSGLIDVMKMNQMIQLRNLDLADNQIDEEGIHSLTERFQQEHKRSLWNPQQLTSMIDRVVLSRNLIPPAVAASTDVFRKRHLPLLNIVW